MIIADPIVSFVLATHNRREVLLRTLAAVEGCGLRSEEFETLVVDNASADGTAEAVAARFPDVQLFALPANRGPVAKNIALEQARGRYVVFLDDDSYPQPGSIRRMIGHFERDPQLGAAVFTVTLPDGSEECSAYPNVFIGCGTGFRRRALRQVGGLSSDFFMQAEEYDLSLRLLAQGWEIRRFDDLHVMHLKTPATRFSGRVMRLDVRNNLMLIGKYFPPRWRWAFAAEWLRRYWFMAANRRLGLAWCRGAAEGLCRMLRMHGGGVDEATFERFARIDETRQRLSEAARRLGLRRIVMVDLGKNFLPYWLAAQSCGLEVVAIADPKLQAPGRTYRGIPIVNDETARSLEFDAAVIANLSPVHAARRRRIWRLMEERPVIDLFERDPVAESSVEAVRAIA